MRDPAVHLAVLRRVVSDARERGLAVLDALASPILGPEGNREFLIHVVVPPAGVGPKTLDRLADARLVTVTGG